MKNNQKGITLIVLIITIIVLLILSVVTINMLFGENNIIGNAGNAKIQSERAEIDDVLQSAVVNISLKQGKELDNLDDYYKTALDFRNNGKISANIKEESEEKQTYQISNYEKTLAENDSIDKVTFKISKNGGTGTPFEYEIQVKIGKVICKSTGEAGGSEDNPDDPDNPDNPPEDDPNKEYTITYNLLDGSFETGTTPIGTYKKGDIVGFPIPVKNGVAFDGWYTTNTYNAGTQMAQTSSTSEGNIVLYAKWIVESNPNYFKYSSPSSGNVTIQRLSKASDFTDTSIVSGEDAYANDADDIINLVIPKTVTINGNVCNVIGFSGEVFKGKNKIKKVALHKNITTLYSNVFKNCTGIEDLTMPITISGQMSGTQFSGCTGIKKARFTVGSASTEGTGYNNSSYAAYTPWYITSQYNVTNNINDKIDVFFDDNITKIGNYMFYNCAKLKLVTFPSSLTTLGQGAFQGCFGMEGEISLGSNVTSIGSSAFKGCTGLTGILQIPELANKTVSQSLLEGCTGIKKLIIPSTITSIEGSAFKNCSGIEEMTLPITIRHSGNNMYTGCTGLKKVRFTLGKDSNGNDSGVGSSYYNNSDTSPWYITSKYNVDNNIDEKIEVTFDENITQIGNYMFYNCAKLKLVTFPSLLTTIESCAFCGCSGMEGEISLGSNITSIGGSAFKGCTGLTGAIQIPGLTNKTISDSTFEGCVGIKKLIIPSTITSIGSSAFRKCSGIEEMTLPITIRHSGNNMYTGCTGLKKVRFTIGKDSSGNDSGVGSSYYNNSDTSPWYITSKYNVDNNIDEKIEVIFDENITQIGYSMFYNCTKLKLVTLPSSLTTIGQSTFSGCSGMEGEISLGSNITAIGSSAFKGCTGLTGTIQIPGLTNKTISDSMFEGCAGIKKLIIPSTITSIGSSAFRNCSGIEEMVLPITIRHSASNMYNGCTGLKKVRFTVGKNSNGSDNGAGSSYYNYYDSSPWYLSRNNNIKVIFENGITSIGSYMFKGQTNATYYFTGTKTQWGSVTINSNNSITIPDENFNYSE